MVIQQETTVKEDMLVFEQPTPSQLVESFHFEWELNSQPLAN